MSGNIWIENQHVRAFAPNAGTFPLQLVTRPAQLIRRPPELSLSATYFPYQILRGRFGELTVLGFNELDLVPAAVRNSSNVYWCHATGSDGDGSFATPWLGIDKALATATYPCTINVLPGVYAQADSWNASTPGGAVWVRKHGVGRAVSAICWASNITITQVAESTTWQATRSNVVRVVDLTNLDDTLEYTELSYVPTFAQCQATPGTWSNDSLNVTVQINRRDGAQVTTGNTRVYLSSVSNGRNPTAADMLVSGIDFEGGNQGAFRCTGNATGHCAFIDCSFKWAGRESTPTDGLQALQIAFVTLVRCTAASNTKDGFNFTAASGTSPGGALFWCLGHRNGAVGSLSNNGLTAHDACKVVDVGGVYEYNSGGNIASTDANTQMWLVGTVSRWSSGDLYLGGTFPSTGFQALVSSQLFLDGTVEEGSLRDLVSSGGAQISVRNHQFGGGTLAGTIATY